MRAFWRREPVLADVGAGFWVAEATALQRSIVTALADGERRRPSVPARLQLTAGAEGRVVVVWRNVIVGFVPPDHVTPLRRQLHAAGRAPLETGGTVLEQGGVRRIWAGPGTPEGEPPADELAAPPTTIFGLAVRGHATGDEPTTTAQRWLLAVGTDSWEVRDGADVDVALLRRRLAESQPGETLHVQVWGEAVAIAPHTRVTLTDPATGEVEVLRPR